MRVVDLVVIYIVWRELSGIFTTYIARVCWIGVVFAKQVKWVLCACAMHVFSVCSGSETRFLFIQFMRPTPCNPNTTFSRLHTLISHHQAIDHLFADGKKERSEREVCRESENRHSSWCDQETPWKLRPPFLLL